MKYVFWFLSQTLWHFDLTWRPSWRNSENTKTRIRFTLEFPSRQGADRHIDCEWMEVRERSNDSVDLELRNDTRCSHTHIVHTKRRALPEQRRFNFRFCCVEHKFRLLLNYCVSGKFATFRKLNFVIFTRKRCEWCWCWWCLSGGGRRCCFV